MPFAEGQFILFTLIFMRMTGFVVLNPLLGRKGVPGYFQAGLSLFLSFLMYSAMAGQRVEIVNAFQYGVLLARELAVGFVLAFVMELFFLAVTYAGSVMDYQMGLSMATVYDPQSNAQQAISGGIWNTYMSLLFFAVNGHLSLIRIFWLSFETAPVGMLQFSPGLAQNILSIFSRCIVLALQFSFPLIALELLTEFAVGVMMKTIPQINIFVINIQAKIIIGLLILLFLFSPMSEFINRLIREMFTAMDAVVRLL